MNRRCPAKKLWNMISPRGEGRGEGNGASRIAPRVRLRLGARTLPEGPHGFEPFINSSLRLGRRSVTSRRFFGARVWDPQRSGKSVRLELLNRFPRERLLRVTDSRSALIAIPPRCAVSRVADPPAIRVPSPRRLPIGDSAGWQPALHQKACPRNLLMLAQARAIAPR